MSPRTAPVTPSRPNVKSNTSIQSTPDGRGTSSDLAYATKHTQKDYLPYIMQEIAQYQQTITVDKFLKIVFKIPAKWRVSCRRKIGTILEDNIFTDELNAYRQPMAHEQQRYQPFVRMLNRIMLLVSQGNSKSNILEMEFARNDPTIILGSAASRKPDTFGGDREVFGGQSRHVDAMAEKGPSGNSLHWSEISTYFEFKRFLESLLNPSMLASLASPVSGPSQPPHVNGSALAPAGRSSGAGGSQSKLKTKTRGSSHASGKGSNAGVPGSSPAQTATLVPKETPDTQCASYALEMLSHGGLRTHVIAALVTDGSIELLYYDRSIMIKSEPFDFIKDPECLVAWVMGMASLDSKGWGFDPALPRVRRFTDITETGKISKSLYKKSTITLGRGWKLRIKGTVFSAHCIIGRATTVFLAQVEAARGAENREWVKKEVIVKLSNPATTRLSEVDMIVGARERANNSKDRWVLNHLPLIIHHQDRKPGRIQHAFCRHFSGFYEMRVPRDMVMELLFPITQLTDAASAAPVYQDILRCYQWLYDVHGILHSDISINNLMYRQDGCRIYGVLNDFDLARRRGLSMGPQSKQRTGTRQFMAVDLLDPKRPHPHFYRHDLESIFYVMVFHMCNKNQEGAEIMYSSAKDWLEIDTETLWLKKTVFLRDSRLRTTEHFTSLSTWLVQLAVMFNEGYEARASRNRRARSGVVGPFDEETLGGHITFDKFKEVLGIE